MLGRVLSLCWMCAAALGCGPEYSEGPFARVGQEVWRTVNRSHRGADGILVQAALHTFAYEISRAYARAEREDLGQEQLEFRIKQLLYSYVDGTYPAEDGTDINSLYLQYLIYVNPSFDARNPLQKRAFNIWRAEYIRRVVDVIYDSKFPILRDEYDDRWGLTLYSRLVFTVYLSSGESSAQAPYCRYWCAHLLGQSARCALPAQRDIWFLSVRERPSRRRSTRRQDLLPSLLPQSQGRRQDAYCPARRRLFRAADRELGRCPLANSALGPASGVSRNACAALADGGRSS